MRAINQPSRIRIVGAKFGLLLLVLGLVLGTTLHADCERDPRPADSTKGGGPSTAALIAVGLGLGIVDYPLELIQHEGAHATVAKIQGMHDIQINLLPSNHDGGLWLGDTTWNGNLSKNQQIVNLLAPKVMNVLMLGGYSALLESKAYPKDKWAQLLLTVAAAGELLDFSKHFVLRNPNNDVERSYTLMGVDHGLSRVPFEILYGGMIAVGALEVGKGFYRLFKKEQAGPSRKPGTTEGSGAADLEMTKYGSLMVGPGFLGWGGAF